jgi:ElaB/YqjD/DUF883 family membrane-anchored ribosome-binding protein
MSKHTSHSDDSKTLAENARELLAATADATGEQVVAARKQVAAALEKAKKVAQATDKAVHQHPYKAIAIAAGAGLLLGFLLSGRKSDKTESDS